MYSTGGISTWGHAHPRPKCFPYREVMSYKCLPTGTGTRRRHLPYVKLSVPLSGIKVAPFGGAIARDAVNISVPVTRIETFSPSGVLQYACMPQRNGALGVFTRLQSLIPRPGRRCRGRLGASLRWRGVG